MSSPSEQGRPFDDVLEPQDDALPDRIAQGHGGMPDRPDDDALDRATQQERVDVGLADYAPDDVPPATDPLPEGTSDAVDLAQRDITEDDLPSV